MNTAKPIPKPRIFIPDKTGLNKLEQLLKDKSVIKEVKIGKTDGTYKVLDLTDIGKLKTDKIYKLNKGDTVKVKVDIAIKGENNPIIIICVKEELD